MSDTPVASTSRNNTHDAKKLYKSVRFQQGRPVLDTELNDLQDITFDQIVSEIKKDSRFSSIETSPFEWAILPLGDTPEDPKNNDNFSITLGRLPTEFGILDSTNNLQERIPYDYQQLVDNGLTQGQLESYPNYLFKGKISSVSSAVKFVDLSKEFKASHNLIGRETTLDLSSATNTDLIFKMKTGSCRILFVSAINAANIGQVRTIVGNDQNSITFDQALPEAMSALDEYVIIPDNMLTTQRNSWDSAEESLTLLGEDSNPLMIPFIQSWEEDISSNEDADIENQQVGMESTHRTQLRWCLRVLALSGQAIRKFGLHYNQITEPTQNILDPGFSYDGANDVRDYVRSLLDSHEMSIGKAEIGLMADSYSLEGADLANATFPTERLLKSHGLSISSDNAGLSGLWKGIHETKIASERALVEPLYSIPSELTSVQGTTLISEAVLRTFGDKGFLDWDILKAFLLIHLYDGKANVGSSISATILGLWSSPSKRLDAEWLDTGADPAQKAIFNPISLAPLVDTLSPSFWVNSIKLLDEVLDTADLVLPRVGFVPTKTKWGCQPSLYVTPPRIFFKQSDATTELATARQKFYGNNPLELMESLRAIYKPADVSRYIIRERDTYVELNGDETDYSANVVYSSVGERLNYLENLLSMMTGLSSVQVLHHAYASHNPQEIKLLPSMANKLLSSDHDQGVAQSGVASSRSSEALDINALGKYVSGNKFEDASMSMGGVNYVNPLTGNNINRTVGDSIDQVVTFDANVNPSIKTREAVNGEYGYKANDESLGFTNRKGINDKREVHEGIAQNLAFMQAFNFRKLAIKTSSHAEGDLFTINVPQWWELKEQDILITDVMTNRVEILDAQGNGTGQFKLSDAFFRDIVFNSLNGQSGTALSSFYSSFRSQLANVDDTGPMGLTSYAGLGLTAPVGETLQQGLLGKDSGPTATNQSLLPFLDKISGSSAIARWDYTGSQDTESGYDASLATSSSALNDLSRSAWGRRSIDPQAFLTIANSQSSGTPNQNSYSAMPSNIDSNRCTSLRLRYHVGDFYPGETDSRGIPENLLVDSLNLYVRVEPLPLVHWMTMPKHQHSILEGSMDMSEAIATLMDLSNGRGIPDHLFTLADTWRPVNEDSDIFGLNATGIPNSRLSIESMISGVSSNDTHSFTDGCTSSDEFLTNLFNSEFNTVLTNLGMPVLVPFGHPANPNTVISMPSGQNANNTPASYLEGDYYLTGEHLGTGEVAGDYPRFFDKAQFALRLKEEANDQLVHTAVYLQFLNTLETWLPLYEQWRVLNNGPVYDVGNLGNFYENGVAVWLDEGHAAVLAQIDQSQQPVTHIHSNDGGLNVTSLQQLESLKQGITDQTLPIISDWLFRAGFDGASQENERLASISEVFPALQAKKDVNVNTNSQIRFQPFTGLSLFSKVAKSRMESLIREIATRDNLSVKEAMKKAFRDDSFKVTVGSIDPVGVCMPTSAHPYVHWYHPNMRAMTAPGGVEGMSLFMGDSASEAETLSTMRYTPYNEWGRDSLIMTGLVPFGGQAERLRISMGFGAIKNYNAQDDARVFRNAGYDDSIDGFDANQTPSSEDQAIFDNIFAYIDGINTDSVINLTTGIYDALFNFTGTPTADNAGDENPFAEGWRIKYITQNNVPGLSENSDARTYTSMLPYFAHSTGHVGLGAITGDKDVNGTIRPTFLPGDNNVDETIHNHSLDGTFDMWANWFPYLPNQTHAKIDAIKHRDATNLGQTIGKRIEDTIFAQHTGPVYLPASRSIYRKSESWTGPAAEDELTTPLDLVAETNETRLPRNEVPVSEYVHEHNVGYHPMLKGISRDFGDKSEGTTGKILRSTLTYPMSDRTSQIIDILQRVTETFNGDDDVFDTPSFIPETDQVETEPFDGAVLRSGMSTETVGWLNLYMKTYNRVYGHKSIHPYGNLDIATEKPVWHKDFEHSKAITSGKGPDKDVDTLYAGDLGTGVYVSKRSIFMDPLCLGVGAVRSSGEIIHDSAEDQEDVYVFRDIFDLCAYEREIMDALDNRVERKYAGIIKTSAAWSKMGMQSKLLFNSSIRVLHTRPSGALSSSLTNQKASMNKEGNYGGNTMPKSLTEMFLCIDPVTNKLHQAPRTAIQSPRHKPFIHLESLIHVDQAGDNEHPNYKVMKRLNPMVSTNLSGKVEGDHILSVENNNVNLVNNFTFDPNNLVNNTNSQDIITNSLKQAREDFSVATSKAGRSNEQFNADLAINMGDAFSVDPFDVMWESSISQTVKNSFDDLPATANTAQNSGVEYELLSSLARIHAQKDNLGLENNFNLSNNMGLIETLPTPNELTLPGDHEIVFVLYTGDYGNQMVNDDVPQGVNPPVAGCHIKASLEINRPSERFDSETYSESGNADQGIHYGAVTPYALAQKSNTSDSTAAYNPTGLHTYSIAGGRPTMDLAVHDQDGAVVAANASPENSPIGQSQLP